MVLWSTLICDASWFTQNLVPIMLVPNLAWEMIKKKIIGLSRKPVKFIPTRKIVHENILKPKTRAQKYLPPNYFAVWQSGTSPVSTRWCCRPNQPHLGSTWGWEACCGDGREGTWPWSSICSKGNLFVPQRVFFTTSFRSWSIQPPTNGKPIGGGTRATQKHCARAHNCQAILSQSMRLSKTYSRKYGQIKIKAAIIQLVS